jgi:outer membrane protein assembly factor BamE
MTLRSLSIVLTALTLTACVYRIDIQQGNLLDDEDIAQVDLGMTRSQVQFLLGTPMIADSFHRDRWDYAYYFRRGRSPNPIQRWFIVYFDNDRVTRIDRDVELDPAG